MIALDEDALICDLAEVYNIYDYRSLPANLVATFSVGLRENSRIKMAISGLKYPFETLLIASAVDRLSILVWSKSKDAEKGRNKPKSIVEAIVGRKNERDYEVFDSPEELEKALAKFKK